MISFRSFYIILVGILLGILYWMVEALVHDIVFGYRHNFIEHIFNISNIELWMRSSFIALIIFMNIILQITVNKLRIAEGRSIEAYNQLSFYKDLFAHDISNMIQSVLSPAELVYYYLNEPIDNREIENLIDIIRRQAFKAKILINSTVNLTNNKERYLRHEIVDALKFLEKSISFLCEIVLSKKLSIQLKSTDQDFLIHANDLLSNVFDNILLNAVRHNENNEIEILIDVSKEKVGKINYMKFEFKDNGEGIPDDLKMRLFQENHNNINSKNGMGIGMYLVKKIISNYDGIIRVEDKVRGDYSQGANFILYFPVAKALY